MPFDVIGWSEATPGTGTVHLTAAVNDGLYSSAGDDINLKAGLTNYYILGVLYTAASTGARALIRQPSLNNDYCFQKCCLEEDLDPTQGYEHYFGRPLPVFGNEKIQALSVNATDESNTIILLIGTSPITQAMLDAVRPTHVITGYADTTGTALTWTQCAVTWNQDLPRGEYAVVGMRASIFKAANPMLGAARLLIPGKTEWRPGVPVCVAEADHEEIQSITKEPWVHFPIMPEITFPNTNMPDIEIFTPTAPTDENVQLMLQKVA